MILILMTLQQRPLLSVILLLLCLILATAKEEKVILTGRRGGGAGAGTKRPYTPLAEVLEEDWIHHHHHEGQRGGREGGEYGSSSSSSIMTVSSCRSNEEEEYSLQYVAMLARHGARYPTSGKMHKTKSAASLVCSLDHLQDAHPAKRWCRRLLQGLEGARGGAINSLGEWEQKVLGKQVAQEYLAMMHAEEEEEEVEVYVRVTSKSRTRESCEAFREGAQEIWRPAQEIISCEEVDEHLLRPYASCPHVQYHRKQVLKTLVTPDVVTRARASIAQGLDLLLKKNSTTSSSNDTLVEEAALLSLLHDDAVMGIYYACQTDMTLFLPSLNDDYEDKFHHKNGGIHKSFACSLVEPVLEAMEAVEDMENYHTRGFGTPQSRQVMAPYLHHITQSMTQALATSSNTKQKMIELFFAHDSTVLPVVALLDLLRLGPDPSISGAARICPFSSRLVVEVWKRKGRRREGKPAGTEGGEGADKQEEEQEGEEEGGERIVILYNDMIVRVLDGGLKQWREDYAEALAVSLEDVCALDEEMMMIVEEEGEGVNEESDTECMEA